MNRTQVKKHSYYIYEPAQGGKTMVVWTYTRARTLVNMGYNPFTGEVDRRLTRKSYRLFFVNAGTNPSKPYGE